MILNDFIQSFGTNGDNQSFDFPLGWFTVILPQFTMRLKRSGFSLVLSLTIMASMVMMVIVLASFLQVESRLAQSNAGYQRARLNALVSARIAIGHLQQTAGPDQRVSMRADMFSPDVAVNPPPAIVPVPAANPNPNKPTAVAHQKRYWTGIWATGGVDSSKPRDWSVADPHDSRLFLGWLTSPIGTDASNPELVDANKLNYYMPNRAHFDTGKVKDGVGSEGQLLINALNTNLSLAPFTTPTVPYVRLVGGSPAIAGQPASGTIQWPAAATTPIIQEFYGAVDLPTMPMPGPTAGSGASIGSKGRFAYWIGDEGIKAKVNLPDIYATSTGDASLPGLTDWDKGFAGSATQRSAFESVTPSINPAAAALMPAGFGTRFRNARNSDILATITAGDWKSLGLPRARSRNEINLWGGNLLGDNTGDMLISVNRLVWHEVTPWSYSVLSDTLNGGMKSDLSTAFELPYSVFRTLELYPGQKEAATTPTTGDRRQSLFHGAPNATYNSTNGMASDLDYNRPNLVDTLGSASDLLKAVPRSPEWAPRYLSMISSIGTTLNLIKTRNAGETPERLGFAYEVPLASAFFNTDRLAANLVNTTTSKNDVLPWADLASTHADNWTARIVRGPTWDLYRNYYRMYKREIEAAATADSSALRGQGGPADGLGYVVRGVEPLTYATGNRGLPTRRAGPAQGDTYVAPVNPELDNFFSGGGKATSYFYRNNLSDGGVGPDFQAERRYKIPFDTSAAGRSAGSYSVPLALNDSAFDSPQVLSTKTWPTSPILAPTILRFSTIYSAVRQFDKLGMTVDPIIVIHNPYDVALEFEGLAMVTSGMSSPFRFIFRATNLTIDSTEYLYAQRPGDAAPLPPPNNRSSNQTIDFGDVVIGGGENDNRSMSFRIVAGGGGIGTTGGGRVIRLEPGEIRVVGTAPSTGDLINNNNTNVSIPADIGYELSSRAFYKMTPFHNVRSRMGSGARNENAERVLWTMDFDICKEFANYDPDGSGPQPPVTWSNGGLSDIEYARRLNDIWNAAKSQRRVHDAFPGWDGSLASFESAYGSGKAMQILTRNQGWVNYNGYVVGAEGETITVAPGPDTKLGTLDDLMTYSKDAGRYIAPTRRNGRIAMQGNQAWNFYLIGKKSIDGGAPLNTHRRWFGSPDEDKSTYIADPINPERLIRRYAEGSQTANGFNLVDESLLLNFQAMTSGWPLYSNPNSDENYYTQPDREWTRPLGQNPQSPSFYIKASSVGMGVPTDPEFNTGNGKGLEVTGAKSDTLFNLKVAILNGGESKMPVFMVDFVRRSADMTSNTTKWYPTSMNSSGFGMNTSTPSNANNDYGVNYKLETPLEIRNAPMTPFFLSDRAQQAQLFGYDGKAHTPVGWVQTQRGLDAAMTNAEIPTTPDKKGAYWGPSVSNDTIGKSNIILYSIPRRPLLSLSQLGTVAFAEKNTDPDLTVGSSFAHPGIGDLTRIVEWPGPREKFPSEGSLNADVQGPVPELGYVAKHMGSRPVRNRSDVRTDHAFAANLALWDTYYFSGLNLQANSYSHLDGVSRDWPGTGADLPIDNAVRLQQADSLAGVTDPKSFAAYKRALNEGKSLLANKRVAYIPDGKASFTESNDYKNSLKLPEVEFPHPKYLSRNSLYDGGFNVNSTSKAAWRAILAGLRGQTLPNGSGTTSATALTRFARAFGPADGANNPWTSYRELNDAEIDDLAAKVVDEVRARGPFMSLSDFVNRRLVNMPPGQFEFGLKGALQAAIDKSAINNTAIAAAGGTFSAPASTSPVDPNTQIWGGMYASSYYSVRGWSNWWKESSAYPNIPANKRFPSIRAMSRTNVESSVTAGLGAPGIVTQMDVLNSVGPNLTARSDTFVVRAYGEAHDDSGNVIGKAWVEVVVQRTSEYVAMAVGQKFPEYTELNRRKLAYRVNTSGGKEYDKQVLIETYERAPAPNPPTATALEKTGLAQEQRLNRIFGRRFRPSSLRWLSANEI